MVTPKEVLAVVQARGGSKGVPGKNLRPLGGVPLIAYSIASGLAAKSVTRLIVSTDDDQIAEVAQHYGAEVPFRRPNEMAVDSARDFPLFEHALRWLADKENYRPDAIVQLRPTTPFRPKGLIDEAVALLFEEDATDCVRGVTQPSQNPYKMWRLAEGDRLQPLLECDLHEPYNMPRQELPATFYQTGHIDVIRPQTILAKQSLSGDQLRAVKIDSRYCVDIDRPMDFLIAGQILQSVFADLDLPEPHVLPVKWPEKPDCVVFDFDGVFTDNRVWVNQDGVESVACNRGDGMGIALLKAAGIPMAVLSTEQNPVVLARCRKLDLPCLHGLGNKGETIHALAERHGYKLENMIFVGNDVNDLECMSKVGFSVAVADAVPAILERADYILKKAGGHGAVRELCDLILKRIGEV